MDKWDVMDKAFKKCGADAKAIEQHLYSTYGASKVWGWFGFHLMAFIQLYAQLVDSVCME